MGGAFLPFLSAIGTSVVDRVAPTATLGGEKKISYILIIYIFFPPSLSGRFFAFPAPPLLLLPPALWGGAGPGPRTDYSGGPGSAPTGLRGGGVINSHNTSRVTINIFKNRDEYSRIENYGNLSLNLILKA